jgi:NDP-sugar pyrophosphorylase family protein
MHAIILAGGKGERLRPLTDDRPKCMVEVCGRPILLYQLAWLRHHGVRDVVISCGYLANVIQDRLGDGSDLGIGLTYAIEREPLGRGGGFRNAMGMFETREPIVALNGDNITNLDLADLIDCHRRSGAMATGVLAPLQSPYGLADLADDSFITGFREKPELPYWLNAGIYVFEPGIFELLPDRGDHEDTTFPRLALERRLFGYPTRAFWRTADTAKDIAELERELSAYDLEAFYTAGEQLTRPRG